MSVIRNVLVWDAGRTDAQSADILLDDSGKIAEIVPEKTGKGGVLFDGGGHTVAIPGLVNAHTHISMTLLRGLGEELPLMEWLQTKIFPVEDRLGPQHIRAGAELALLEMLAGGVTCFADMYYFMRDVAAVTLSSGMRAALSRGITGDDPVRLNENLSLAEEFNGRNDRIVVQLGPHAPYTVPREAIAHIAEVAREKKLGVHFHWLETEGELKTFHEKFKISPTDYLESAGLFDVPKLLLAHSVWHPVEELGRLKRENVTLVHNPKSNLKLGSGYAPIREMLKAGVNMAIGTDGAASNNRLDVWDEMRAAALMHKGYHMDPTLLSAREVLRMATVAGAQGMGFENVGLIEPGYYADLALIDVDAPEYVGMDRTNVPEFIVYAGSSRQVRATLVAGRILYCDGEYMTFDREEILSKCKSQREEIVKK